MMIKRIEPWPLAKIVALIYVAIGLIVGLITTIWSIFFQATMMSSFPIPAAIGIASVIILPVVYGITGLLGSLIVAWLYNVISDWIGGIEIQTS